MSTLAEYICTIMKIKRNLVDRFRAETDYCKGYNQAVEDMLYLIDEYKQMEDSL